MQSPALFSIHTQRIELSVHTKDAQRSNHARGLLRVIPRRDGVVLGDGTYRLGVPAPAAKDLGVTNGPPLFEETTYSLLVRSRDDRPVDIRHRDPLILRDLRSDDGGRIVHGTINFRSQVGRSRFAILNGQIPEIDLELEVFPSKIDFQSDYAAMAGEVQDLAAGLALEYLRATHQLGLATEARSASRLDWVLIVRHVIGDLDRALRFIASSPQRSLKRKPRLVRAEALRRSDNVLRRAVRGGRGRGERIALSSGLKVRRYLPERGAEPTLDTLEHRWLATQLAQIRLRLARIIRDEHSRQIAAARSHRISARDKQALAELSRIEATIATLEGLPPFKAAEGLPPSGFTSLKLQGAPGYREAFQTLVILRQGLRIGGGAVELSVKDIHLLYEYWCFLTVVRLISEVVEVPIPAEQLLEVHAEGLRIRLKRGRTHSVKFPLAGNRKVEVAYNPAFQDPDALLPQQPDFVLSVSDPHWPTIRLVLDAKYRIEEDTAFLERFGSAGPPPDAINVLHRYRDAILESEDVPERELGARGRARAVIEGAALFPLNADRANAFDQSKFWRSLERLGVGALPLLPGSTAWFEQWLRNVLQRNGWEVARQVVPHAAEESEHRWKSAAETPVLVGVLRSDAISHLQWIEEKGLYYTPLTPSQPRQLACKYIAIYEPGTIRQGDERGCVARWAEIASIEVVPREDIATPWRSSRSGGSDLQVLYRIEPLRPLATPVVNQQQNGKPQRFSQHRWTSLLGLERATNLTELLLETAAEWEFYERLRTSDIWFCVRAERAGVTGQQPRASFIIGDAAVRILSPANAEVRINSRSFEMPPRRVVRWLARRSRGEDQPNSSPL